MKKRACQIEFDFVPSNKFTQRQEGFLRKSLEAKRWVPAANLPHVLSDEWKPLYNE